MKRSEYEKKAKEFRAHLNHPDRLKKNDWPDNDSWLSVAGTSTCTTPSCVVFGQAFPVTLHENADGIYRGMCGQCGQSTTTVPTLEEG